MRTRHDEQNDEWQDISEWYAYKDSYLASEVRMLIKPSFQIFFFIFVREITKITKCQIKLIHTFV